jgi:hypothetical protein
MSSGLESEELRVRQSLLYTVGRICDEEGPWLLPLVLR